MAGATALSHTGGRRRKLRKLVELGGEGEYVDMDDADAAAADSAGLWG